MTDGRGPAAGRQDECPPRILSSEHLARGPHPSLSEFEFGLMVAHNAFARWVVRCMRAAGEPDLAITDVLVLHHVHHRGRSKRLADICFTLNYEDSHVINYSIKKLVSMKLARGEKVGKEVFYATTPAGAELLERFRKVRNRCLLPAVEGELADAETMSAMAARLRMLSGLYDQAARAASSL
ncbi:MULTISPECIES: winged helix DNA-binding protein [Pusillimonas]|uniref:winged helix DNA-binding protein n=1 Tax=Pusillimonas TaxID=305976 RepID=UPI000E59F541|nr:MULTISPECIES: winged helix DNA-binding protein [Pusillimonas]MDX3894351.1 winged helix DNA-binding protein [Pusillimonas sp.]TFL15720.1 transcriptional regulator [Pusillimonas caeni]